MSAAPRTFLRWSLLGVCLCVPQLALLYLPAHWAVGIALFAGYEARTVIAVFGAPFEAEKRVSGGAAR